MSYRNLAECVADLERAGQLVRIDAEIDPHLELAAIQRRAFAAQAPALLFTRVKGSRFPMLSNLFGTRERLQAFEGTVIARRNGGCRETFTVRRVSYGIGVERTFPLHSPRVDSITVIRRGKVRRAKLYYLRSRVGKAAKVKDR